MFRERAVDAARAAVGGSDDSKTKRQLAALLADAAEAEWSVFDLDKAAENFAEAQQVVAEFDEGLAAHYKKLQADALAAKGEFRGDNDAFDQAMTLYDEAMGYYDGQADDDIWAETANDFAKALAIYGDRREDNEYLEDFAQKKVWAAMVWSGDLASSGGEDDRFIVPEEGVMIWTDNMLIPKGAANKYTAELMMNYVYDPKVAAQIADYIYYVSPVNGAAAEIKALDPGAESNPLLFPDAATQAKFKNFQALTPEQEDKLNELYADLSGV